MRRWIGVLAAATMAAAGAANGQEAPRRSAEDWNCSATSTPIMILGVYHMQNSGQDAIVPDVDDVRSPRRQVEMEALVGKLAAFAPTMIAVEEQYRTTGSNEQYAEYLAGRHQLSPHEIQQIGFRLAKRQGLKSLSPVDHPMWMNGWARHEMDLTRMPPRKPVAEADKPARQRETEQRLRTSTLTEHLRWMNSREYINPDHAGYLNALRPATGVYMYERTDPLVNWYKRNVRIMTNLMRYEPKPQDRILLLIGAGHQYWLREMAIASGDLCLVDSDAYLR